MSSHPVSIRWSDPSIGVRLDNVRRRAGLSQSAAINVLVDEALRMREHPGIVFRDGPAGRRAGLAAGPDVWEVVRALKAARESAPEVTDRDRVALVSEATDLGERQIETAISYYAAWQHEVDREVADAERAEDEALAAFERRQGILA